MKRRDMKRAAKEALSGRWLRPILITLLLLLFLLPSTLCSLAATTLQDYVYSVMDGVPVMDILAGYELETLLQYSFVLAILGAVLFLLVDIHAYIGYARYFLRFRQEKATLWTFLGGFFRKYFRAIVLYISITLRLMFWWVILIACMFLFMPAALIPLCILIKRALDFSMAHFVLAENPRYKVREILDESIRIMKGCKWKFLMLEFSFLGWYLLCGLTCGLMIPVFLPYHMATLIEFYHYAKER